MTMDLYFTIAKYIGISIQSIITLYCMLVWFCSAKSYIKHEKKTRLPNWLYTFCKEFELYNSNYVYNGKVTGKNILYTTGAVFGCGLFASFLVGLLWIAVFPLLIIFGIVELLRYLNKPKEHKETTTNLERQFNQLFRPEYYHG